MKRRRPFLLLRDGTGVLAFHTGEHANDDWRPDAPANAAHAFAAAVLSDGVHGYRAAD